MKPQKAKTLSIHPKAQVIITGKPLTPEQANEVIQLSQNLFVNSWCAPDGSIGYIDAVNPNTTYDKLYTDLLELTMRFSFLDLGVTVMNGPPGSFTQPVVGFAVKGNSVKRSENPHMGHPAPRRVKKVTSAS